MSVSQSHSLAIDAATGRPNVSAGGPRALGEAERVAHLRLARSQNVGPRTYLHLLRRFCNAADALDALPTLAARGGSAKYSCYPPEAAEAEAAAAAALGARLLVLGEPGFPVPLTRIDTPPPVLWVQGDAALTARPMVAIVGARNASALGLRTARKIARALGEAGWVVVSGLARGIDAAAHEAALESGTVAVLAGGLDKVYPPENVGLAARIAEAGVLLSEAPMGAEPTNRHFPKRNRLVAGLSKGVLLIEAASRSGSLITARYALDQGREVMAVPGAPEDPRAGGCNALIRDGAALIREAADVLEVIGPADAPGAGHGLRGLAEEGTGFSFDGAPFEDEPDFGDDFAALEDFDLEGSDDGGALAEQILRLVGPHPVELDELARACGTGAAQLSLAVLELELAGRIETLSGQRVVRMPDDI